MSWRVAKSLEKLRTQANNRWPNRSRISDGTIGDAAHSSRTSDHNPDRYGVVRALDLTHDPLTGADMGKLTESIRKSKDPRIKYVLYNHRMYSSYASGSYKAWTWRPYSGSNPHTRHAHFSVVADARADSTKAWAMPKRPKVWQIVSLKGDRKQKVRRPKLKGAMKRVRNRLKKGWRVRVRKVEK